MEHTKVGNSTNITGKLRLGNSKGIALEENINLGKEIEFKSVTGIIIFEEVIGFVFDHLNDRVTEGVDFLVHKLSDGDYA